MARIPDEEIERLKREVSLERLVAGSGVELRPHGKDLVGRCPFHDDREPSLVVTPAKNLWHCLGACNAGGSVIDWVMRTERVSFRRAVEVLRDLAGCAPLPLYRRETGISRETGDGSREKPDDADLPLPPDLSEAELLARVVGFYHETLKQSPEALEYLEKRGLFQSGDRSRESGVEGRHSLSPVSRLQPPVFSEMIDAFKLGYANRTLAYRLPERAKPAGAAIRGRLQSLGILRESGHEHFTGALVIPVFDERGDVKEIYGRKIAPECQLRKGSPRHLYLSRKSGVGSLETGARLEIGNASSPISHQRFPVSTRGVWNLQALPAAKEIILCEALIDALTFWVNGFRNVTAAYGVNGFTEDHLAAFKRHGTERALIAYDRDEAGDKAAAALAERLLAEGIECFRVNFPKGMDANAYALKVTPASKSLAVLLRSAVWLGKGKKTWPVVREPWPEEAGGLASASAGHPAEPPVETSVPFLAASSESFPAEAAKNESAAIQESAPEHSAAVQTASLLVPETVTESLSATLPLPPGPGLDIPAQVTGDEAVILLGDRRWRVRGFGKNLSYDLLKVNVLVSRGEAFHVDTFDLYSARCRAVFVKQASLELGVSEEALKRDLGRVLLKLEELQDEQIRQALEPKEKTVPLTPEERAEALALLKAPDLLARILADFETCGVVGEETNKLVGYLSAVSRKLERPLAVLVQSSSAAGKSALMEAVLAFVPEEEKVKYSAMTGQSLFYMSETDLKNKVLAIAEEEGAERAAYALKLLQSEGELSIASTGKDPATGRLVTHEYKVEGPVMIFLTTTSIEIDEELQNRCIVLTVNEGREQTKAIHRKQREMETLEGLLALREAERVKQLHRNAQRLLKPVLVANPYARELTFLDDATRTRRDHKKYLSLIRSIACLHQHQRGVKTTGSRGKPEPYIEVTLDDIETANRLAGEVLGRSLDELPPQTRRFLELLEGFVSARCAALAMAREDFRFSRRDAREGVKWSYDQVRVHLDRLVELEYVLAHRGGRGQRFEYELLYDGKGKDGKPFLPGLIDAAALRRQTGSATMAGTLGGLRPGLVGEGRALGGPLGVHLAPFGASLGGGQTSSKPFPEAAFQTLPPESPEKTLIGGNGRKPLSYHEPRHTALTSLAAKKMASAAAGAGEDGFGESPGPFGHRPPVSGPSSCRTPDPAPLTPSPGVRS